MDDLTEQYAAARQALRDSAAHDVRRGFNSALLLVVAAVWLSSLGALVYLAHRISRPVRQLTQGLKRVAAGDLDARVESGGSDEIGAAVDAFNHMAEQLQHARERLIHVTRLASWQALARKMAHEVKNSLTPIRLTMEEIVSRREPDQVFLEQAGANRRGRSDHARKAGARVFRIRVGAAGDARVHRRKRAGGGAHRVPAVRAPRSDLQRPPCAGMSAGGGRSPT